MNLSKVRNSGLVLRLLRGWAVCFFVSAYGLCFSDEMVKSAAGNESQISIIEVGVDIEDVPKASGVSGGKSGKTREVEPLVSKTKKASQTVDGKTGAVEATVIKGGAVISIIEVGVDLDDVSAALEAAEVSGFVEKFEEGSREEKVDEHVPEPKKSDGSANKKFEITSTPAIEVAEQVLVDKADVDLAAVSPVTEGNGGLTVSESGQANSSAVEKEVERVHQALKVSQASITKVDVNLDDASEIIETGEVLDVGADGGLPKPGKVEPDASKLKQSNASAVDHVDPIALLPLVKRSTKLRARGIEGLDDLLGAIESGKFEGVVGEGELADRDSDELAASSDHFPFGSKSLFRKGMGGQESRGKLELSLDESVAVFPSMIARAEGRALESPDVHPDTREGKYFPTHEVTIASNSGFRFGTKDWRDSGSFRNVNDGGSPYAEAYPLDGDPLHVDPYAVNPQSSYGHSYPQSSYGGAYQQSSYGYMNRYGYTTPVDSRLETEFSLFTRDFDPDEADVKLGGFYFELTSIEAGGYYYDSSGSNRGGIDDGWGSFVGFRARGAMRISSSLFITMNFGLVYLPQQDRLIFDYGNLPLLQLKYSDEWGLWDVEIFDELGIYSRYGSGGFGSIQGYIFGYQDRGSGNSIYNNPIWVNHVGVRGARPLSEDWRLQLAADHIDYWGTDYGGSYDNTAREHFGARLGSDGASIPFSPYVSYDANSSDYWKSIYHRVYIGGYGRLTENLRIDGRVGYGASSGQLRSGGDGVLWRIGLEHDINEITRHGIQAGQDYFTDPFSSDSTVAEYLRYYLSHDFSECFSASVYAQRSQDRYVSGTLTGVALDRETYALQLFYRSEAELSVYAGAFYETRNSLLSTGRSDERWYYRANLTKSIGERSAIYFRFEYTDENLYDETFFLSGVRRYF